MDDTDIAPVFLPDVDSLTELDDFHDELVSEAFDNEWDLIRNLDESGASSGNPEHVDVVTADSIARSGAESSGLPGRNSIKRNSVAAGLVNDLDLTDTCSSMPKTTNFDFHLQDACLRINRSNGIKMPWEIGFGASLLKRNQLDRILHFLQLDVWSLLLTMLSAIDRRMLHLRGQPRSLSKLVGCWRQDLPNQTITFVLLP